MAVLEIVLAVILTLLGFAILAILLTRWTRRKQNEIDISRYSSEQSAGLLDYEDDRDFSSPRSKRGRGFRNLYSTESDISYDNREGYNRNYTPSTSSLVLPQESVSDTNDLKATPELLPGTVGPITGTIGPIMQFTAPIPGATGPIKLSQKTIVQTPGPIVQYTGPSAETSETTSESTPYAVNGPAPQALTCPPSMLRGLPLAPIMISQRTSTRPEKSKVRQEPPTHVAVPIITPVPIVIGPVAAVDSSGKVTLSPMEEKSEPRRHISQQPTVTSKPVGTTSGQTMVTSKPVRTVSTQTVTTKESPMSRTILPTGFAEPIAKTSPPLKKDVRARAEPPSAKATPPVTTKATPPVTKKNPEFHAGSREESGSADIRRKGDWRRAASAPSSNLRKCSKTEAKSGTGETRKTTPKQDIYLRIQVVPPQNSQSGPKYQHKRALSGPEENYGKGQIQKPGVKVEKLPEKTLSKEGKRVKDDKRKGIGEVMDKENKTEKANQRKEIV
nr:uncharacterized protein C6orf10 homolog isoform X2 [Bubalus bubalis]